MNGTQYIPEPAKSNATEQWRQPEASNLFFCNIRVHMSQADFDKLADYAPGFVPTDVYAGKMWLRRSLVHDWLCWYEADPVKLNSYSIQITPIRVY